MTLEDQVAPFTLAQRMKELGFPQDTQLAWAIRNSDGETWLENRELCRSPICAAPTVAELGVALPDRGTSQRIANGWAAYMIGAAFVTMTERCATEAEARARLWIALTVAGRPEAAE